MSFTSTMRMLRFSRKQCGLLVAGLAVVLTGWGVWKWEDVRLFLMGPIACVDAEIQRSEMAYRYTLPAVDGAALVRLAEAPTPISATYSTENASSVFVGLYESRGTMTLACLDKHSMRFHELPVPGALLTYAMLPDRRNPDILWVSSCVQPALWRLDTRTGQFVKVYQAGLRRLEQFPDCPSIRIMFGQSDRMRAT